MSSVLGFGLCGNVKLPWPTAKPDDAPRLCSVHKLDKYLDFCQCLSWLRSKLRQKPLWFHSDRGLVQPRLRLNAMLSVAE